MTASKMPTQAQKIYGQPHDVIRHRLRPSTEGLKRGPELSFGHGAALWAAGWLTFTTLWWLGPEWVLEPAFAGGMRVGSLTALAVSLPVLIDHEVDFHTAKGPSFSAGTRNSRLMVNWASLICIALLFGAPAGLLGLVIVFPMIGYATWHAYCELFKGDMQ